MNFNDILKMLDWNNDAETQEEGRRYAGQIECLSVFMQPMDRKFNKNIWDNCALILNDKEDALLTPYLFQLLDWLQDMNWPGAAVIFERLQKYQDHEKLGMAVEDRIKMAKALEDEIWAENLAELTGRMN